MNFAGSRFNNSVCTGDLDFNESFSLYIHHDPIQRKVSVRRAGWTSGSRNPNIDFSGLVRGVFLQGALDTRGYYQIYQCQPILADSLFNKRTGGWKNHHSFLPPSSPFHFFHTPKTKPRYHGTWDSSPFIHHSSTMNPHSYWTMAMSRGCALLAQRRPSSPGYKDST